MHHSYTNSDLCPGKDRQLKIIMKMNRTGNLLSSLVKVNEKKTSPNLTLTSTSTMSPQSSSPSLLPQVSKIIDSCKKSDQNKIQENNVSLGSWKKTPLPYLKPLKTEASFHSRHS
jgi:hypothetical protein